MFVINSVGISELSNAVELSSDDFLVVSKMESDQNGYVSKKMRFGDFITDIEEQVSLDAYVRKDAILSCIDATLSADIEESTVAQTYGCLKKIREMCND